MFCMFCSSKEQGSHSMYVKVRHSVRIRLLLASLGLEAVRGFARKLFLRCIRAAERPLSNHRCDCGLLMPSHFLAHQETQADSDQTISFLFVDYLHLTIHSHNMFLFSCQGWNRYFAIVQMVEFCPVCPGLFS